MAQEAHEAIRPTDLSLTPDRIKKSLTHDQFRLYQLIYARFVASQMAPAVFMVTDVAITAGAGALQGAGQGPEVRRPPPRLAARGKQEDELLPTLTAGQALDLQPWTRPSTSPSRRRATARRR